LEHQLLLLVLLCALVPLSQDREQQSQQLHSHISAQQQEINELRMRLAHLEQQQQLRQ
jgi:septal ring factor EnvC (AmiA/AmiB activator)